jgi:dimethylaniline monooxygenase (N-oxide forming)
MATPRRVAIIGAGAGGLCAARHLLAAGIEVEVFELGSHIGGLWVYENDTGRSPAYRSLHINSEAKVTAYPDFPFPEGTKLFPSHEQVHRYLQLYADRFGVTEHIRFNTEVTRVAPADVGGWQVTLGDSTERSFDGVVVATGHQSDPSHPPFRDDFTGTYLHAHGYRTPEPFLGDRVLVIGTGNSGLDISADVCGVAETTFLSARSPVLIMPRMLLGVPTARVMKRIERRWMPWPVRRRLRILVSRLAHGPMERWGFVTPKTETHPAGHQTLMSYIAYERIKVCPGVERVDGTEVTFADGTTEQVDTMIAATGYELRLPFLDDELVPVRGRRVDLYKRVVPPGLDGLYLVGYFNVSGGANIRMMDIQARWVASIESAKVDLPDEATMRRWIEDEKAELAERFPHSPRYGLELDPIAYPEAVREELDGAAPGREGSDRPRSSAVERALAAPRRWLSNR